MLSHDVRDLGTVKQEVLTLQNGDLIYEAIWLREGENAWPAFPDHALVEAVGVCAVEGETRFSTRRPRLFIRHAGDVRVVGRWSTWKTPQIAKLGAAALGLLLASAVAVVVLRRQVRSRTAELAATNQHLTREIEERKQAQQELDRALMTEREVSELRARFVSMVSHEFRTPLGIIMSAVELLRNYLDRLPAPKRAQLLDDIHNSTRRMSGLMEQVLLLGKVESGRLHFDARPIDIVAICQTLADETRSAVGEKCRIDLHFDGEFAGAQGDEAMLRHILGNLLSNAVKYSPEEGTVHLRARRLGDAVEFVVEDQGIGIPVSEQPRLFQAFHRCSNVGNTPGTGLGLLIVKRCVELQGGTIGLESSAGAGTTFTVRLPLVLTRQVDPKPA